MARKPSKTLTDRELEIMQVLWSLGQARLGEVQEALNQKGGEPVALSTVATQLNLLVRRGYVASIRKRKLLAHLGVDRKALPRYCRSLYVPTYSREEATRSLLDHFLAWVGLGRVPAFLIQLLKDERLTPEDRAALQEILRESEPRASSRSRHQPPASTSSEESTP
jgi:predicted transcriptional regulator